MHTHRDLPEHFGRYRILKKLGAGGMGAVYLAHDSNLDRPVALKVPHFAGDDAARMRERFLREARAAATLNHPNLCRVYDVGVHNSIDYFTMPFVDGNPLSKLVGRDRPWQPAQACDLIRKVALAVELLHRTGIVHRDLKPSNIIVRANGEPVLMDFGLARSYAMDSPHLTASGVAVGTPAYMSPEQVDSTGQQLGPAADVYSLGMILFELVTGQLPFEGPNVAVFAQILNATPPPPSSVRPGVPPEIDALCGRTLAKRPEQRFPSMAAFAAELERYCLQAPALPFVAPAAVAAAAPSRPPLPRPTTAAPMARPTLTRPTMPEPVTLTLLCSRCGQPVAVPPLPGGKPLCFRCQPAPLPLPIPEQAAVPTLSPSREGTVIAHTQSSPEIVEQPSRRRSLPWILVGAGSAVVAIVVVVLVILSRIGNDDSRRDPAGARKDSERDKDQDGNNTDVAKDVVPPKDTPTKDGPTTTTDKPRTDAASTDKTIKDGAPIGGKDVPSKDKPATDKPEQPMPGLVLDMPNELTAVVGQTSKITVRVKRTNCTGPVQIVLANQVVGITLQPATLLEAADQIDLTLMIAANAAAGDRTIRFRATCGLVQQENSLALTLRAPRLTGIDEATLKPTLKNGVGMNLRLIRRGRFLMGSPATEMGRQDDEGLSRETRLAEPYYMGTMEVSVAQFRQFVDESKYAPASGWDTGNTYEHLAGETLSRGAASWQRVNWTQTDQHPVVNISWADAVAFCDWLSKKEEKIYQLPTEAEWEYACRAGTTTARHAADNVALTILGNVADLTFKGQFADKDAITFNDNFIYTAPGGSLEANAWGLYDMYGNVAEWCADTYKSYPKTGPQAGVEHVAFRVVRGGSWYDPPAACRSASRGKYNSSSRLCTIGFRVIMRPTAAP